MEEAPKITTSEILLKAGINSFSYREIQENLRANDLDVSTGYPRLDQFYLWQCWRYIELKKFHEPKDTNEAIKKFFKIPTFGDSKKIPRLYLKLSPELEDDGSVTIEWVPIWGAGKHQPWTTSLIFYSFLIQSFCGEKKSTIDSNLRFFFSIYNNGQEIAADTYFRKSSLLLHFKILLDEIRVFYFGNNLLSQTSKEWEKLRKTSPEEARFITHIFNVWNELSLSFPVLKEIFKKGQPYEDSTPELEDFCEIKEDIKLINLKTSSNDNSLKIKPPKVNIKEIDTNLRNKIFNFPKTSSPTAPNMETDNF